MNREIFFASFFPPIQNSSNILIFDGGMGTECERLGANINHELWSTKVLLENPEMIQQVHTNFLKNGADLIGTATYQLSQELLTRFDPKLTVANVVNLSVQVAAGAIRNHRVVEKERLIAQESRKLRILGCVGSIGAAIPGAKEFSGEYPQEYLTAEYMTKFHYERLDALIANPSVNALLIETMPRLDEVLVILDLLKEKFFTDNKKRKIPVFVSFSGKRTEKNQEVEITSGFGDEVGESFRLLSESYDFVCAVGVNCCVPQVVDAAYKRYLEVFFDDNEKNNNQKQISPAFIGYPNSGEVFDGSDRTWHRNNEDETSASFSSLGDWLRRSTMSPLHQNARGYPMILGGCCRTTPENDIKGIAEVCSAVREFCRN